MKHQYEEGAGARKSFEEGMQKLFRAPKPAKPPKEDKPKPHKLPKD